MNVTNYLELNKPQDADQFDVSHFNQNADAIDTAMESSLENMAPVEPYQTATQAHAKGTYLVRNGYLYKTTDAIAVGENISQKTYRTDLNTELKTLQDSVSPEEWYLGSPYHVRAWRLGRIVTLTVITDPINGAGIGSNTTIATLPQGWRPAYNVSATCIAGGVYDMTLYPDGTLNIWNLDVQGAYVRGNLTYVTSG